MTTSMEAPPGSDQIAAARALARALLGGGRRWDHTMAVAARAGSASGAVEARHRAALVAAAWLHDIGYAAPLIDTGFHPLDGARHLRRHGWPSLVVGLVAHHSGARHVADVRGLGPQLAEFSDRRYVEGPVADALTYADQTVGPDGAPLGVQARLDDVLRRHGPESPNARCHALRGPEILAAVARTEAALRGLGGRGVVRAIADPRPGAATP